MKKESVYRQPALKQEDEPEKVYPVVYYTYPRIKHNEPLYWLSLVVVLIAGLMFVWFMKAI